MSDWNTNTIRAGAGPRAVPIDEGLRAHMNKVYGTMSVGMLITFAAAWAISGLAVTSDPSLAAAQLGADTYLTSIAFAGLSLYGYVTKRDLSGMGTFLMMGVIGLLVAMVVNLFLQSSAMAFAISTLGVLIFAGLTAYDTQNIKATYVQHAAHGDAEWLGKAAIMGALNLYLDFINMFMFLLQLFGNRE